VDPQGNLLSSLALFAWIPIALWIGHRWGPAKAAALLFLVPVMLLPEGVSFKPPGIPEFNKGRVAIFWLFAVVLLFHRQRFRALRLNRWITFAILLLLGGSVVTVLLNRDPISGYAVHLPGHRPYDAVHLMIINTLDCVLPFTLAAAMFQSRNDLRVFLRIFVSAALLYSVLQLVELKLSPQLHRWIYGFHQHGFVQTLRGGGYRPMVFMHHGLALAMFTMTSVIAAAGHYKAGIRPFRVGSGWVLTYLWCILFLSKSLAAFLYSLVAVALVLFASPKWQLRVATALALIVLLYPDFRGAGIIPVDDIEEWISAEYGADRAQSVMFRFVNEEQLLERANERSFFGWGSHCRSCIFAPMIGKKISVSDGDWIITWGMFGRVGFVGKYLLLIIPLIFAARRLKYVRRQSDRRMLGALALITAFSAFDLLPNGNFNYLVFVFSGVLMGCTEGIVRDQRRAAVKRRKAHAAMALQAREGDLMAEPSPGLYPT